MKDRNPAIEEQVGWTRRVPWRQRGDCSSHGYDIGPGGGKAFSRDCLADCVQKCPPGECRIDRCESLGGLEHPCAGFANRKCLEAHLGPHKVEVGVFEVSERSRFCDRK